MRTSLKNPSLSRLIEGFFLEYLMEQKQVSPHTISSYRDTFRMLFRFLTMKSRRMPSGLFLDDLPAEKVLAFLRYLETEKKMGARSRNQRLSAIRSFFRYVSFKYPEKMMLVEQVLAIPNKQHSKRVIEHLFRDEMEALLKATNPAKWLGRRDRTLLLIALQTGLRASELTNLKKEDIKFGQPAYIPCIGKGRKERSVPLTTHAVKQLQGWIAEGKSNDYLFPNRYGGKLSTDGFQYILSKYREAAEKKCPSLKGRRLSPHVLRHTAAMNLLDAGVDRALIALLFGHASTQTTDIYFNARMKKKQELLDKTATKASLRGRYRPSEDVMSFLDKL